MSPPRAVRLLQGLLLITALGYICLFIYVAVRRMRYPYELEWLEGSMVDCVQRLLSGKKLYVSPSLDFTCYQYTPLYYYFSAAVSLVLGIGFFPLRLVSMLATTGTFVMICLLVKHETREWYWGMIATGLYAAMFRISGGWFDLARADAMFVFLLVAGVYALRICEGRDSMALLAAVLFLLSYYTKQPALIVAMPMIAYLALVDRRRALVFTGVLAVGIASGTRVLDLIHRGWYSYYTVDLLWQHRVESEALRGFWSGDLLNPLPIVVAGTLAMVVSDLKAQARRRLFFPFLVAGCLVASWLGRLHTGGYSNSVMPGYAALSLAFPVAMASVIAWARMRRTLAVAGLLAVALMQFLLLLYNPAKQIPTAQDLLAGRRLIERLRAIPGEVYMPFSGFYPSMAGKRSFAHMMTVGDMLRGTDRELQDKLLGEIQQAFREKKFQAVVLPTSDIAAHMWQMAAPTYRRLPEPIFDDPNVFWPVTSLQIRPVAILVPRR